LLVLHPEKQKPPAQFIPHGKACLPVRTNSVGAFWSLSSHKNPRFHLTSVPRDRDRTRRR